MFNNRLNTAIIAIAAMCSCLFLAAGASNALAGTYYVSPSGSASWPSCSNINTPCSPQTAFANAQADDIVYFRGGTYDVGTDPGDGYRGALQPANSGTQGHPITFMAYPGETPVLNGHVTSSNEVVRVLSSGDGTSNWITFDGFVVQADGGTRAGTIQIGGSGYPGGTGFVVKNCTINAGTSGFAVDDNRDGIRVNNADQVTISNNKIFGFAKSGGSTDNFAGIKLYRDTNVLISNNELYNNLAGISCKRFSSDITIAYNYIHDNRTGVIADINTGWDYSYYRWHIHDNLINQAGSSQPAIDLDSQTSGAQYAYNFEVYNNTIRNVNSACAYVGKVIGFTFYNNICSAYSNGDYGLFTTVNDASTIAEEDYNQWGTNQFLIQIHRYGSTANYSSLSSWKSSGQLAGGGNPGAGDLASDPLFTDASGSFSRIGDFTLAGNSPCKGTGKGGADMGANIGLVGLNGGNGGHKPSPPSNLR